MVTPTLVRFVSVSLRVLLVLWCLGSTGDDKAATLLLAQGIEEAGEVWTPDTAGNLPLERRVYILSKTYAEIPLHFAHWRGASFKPEQLDDFYQAFLRRALSTESRKEFAYLMREFIALLGNTHSWYWDGAVFGATLPIGFSWVNLDGQWTVTSSSVEGMSPGDLVLEINEEAVDDHYRKLAKYLAGSSERARQGQFLDALAPLLPEMCLMKIRTQAGAVQRVSVRRTTLPADPPAPKTTSRWIEPGAIAYLKVPSFLSPELEQDALEQLRAFSKATAIVVDVRGNPGGSTPAGLLEALMNKPYRWWTEGTPLTLGLFRYYAQARPDIELNEYFRDAQLVWRAAEEQPKPEAYAGRLILLTDRVTGSAAEDFVVPFKDNGRALIIGETTNGSTGQPYFFDFGDGIQIGIGTKRAFMPSGAEFEGIGITPDITVPLRREDLYAGTDFVLERAVAEAQKE